MRLARAEWTIREADHHEHVRSALADVIHRRDRGLKHPVDDFLFHYYNLRPSQLRAWQPGIGVELADAPDFLGRPFMLVAEDKTATLDLEALLAKRGPTVVTAMRLLAATVTREPRFGCFGMHEWAMVYRLAPGQTRHPYLPLRYPPEEIARIVEEVGCRCSHFDAFRFFTPSARPLNLLRPSRESQIELDQPGCLHVNMDLYKWAGKLGPAVPSELLFDSFQLARDIRAVDMRASAYDLTDWGYAPIAVETAAGRAEYVSWQREFWRRAAPLREQLLEICQLMQPFGPPRACTE